jgi:hypothetical protein
MATGSPDVSWRISKSVDQMISQRFSGTLDGTGVDTLLIGVKAFLDANFASFKDSNGNYTTHHINAAITNVLSRGK